MQRWLPLPHVLFLSACLLAFHIQDVRAQGIGTVRTDVENDYFDFFRAPDRRSDDNYTQGIHIGMWFATSPGWVRRKAPSCAQFPQLSGQRRVCISSQVEVGQELYTPTTDATFPLRGERPYAALLYTDVSAATVSNESLQVYKLRFGTTGPAALGDKAQTWFHGLIPEFRTPLGWKHQIATEPIFAATYEYQRLALDARPASGLSATLAPNMSVTVGNLLVAAKAAIDARAGYRTPHPWLVSTQGVSGVRLFVLVGVREDWVGHSLLLQGNTNETRDLVTKRAFVAERYLGGSAGISRWSLEFKIVTRTQEYKTAPQDHRWGTIAMSYDL
jgi:lipid A 3-O-deacylase